MRFTGSITSIKSSRGKKVMTMALTPDVSMDELDNYSDKMCEIEIGVCVKSDDGKSDGVEVDVITGEIME